MARVTKVRVAFFLVALMIGLATTATSEELTISVPAMSDTGAYIVKLNSKDRQEESGFQKEVELYRNKDGGQYDLIASGPLFKAISQTVNQNGVYGYKVRWKSASDVTDFSDEAFVTVKARVTQEDFARARDSVSAQEMRVVSARRP